MFVPRACVCVCIGASLKYEVSVSNKPSYNFFYQMDYIVNTNNKVPIENISSSR